MSRFPTYSCKAADELNCSGISITPIFKGINVFCLILLSLYNRWCSCVLSRGSHAQLSRITFSRSAHKRPAQAGTQPKDTGREEHHKPNAKRFISAVGLRDNCDRCPSAARTVTHRQLRQGSPSPGTPRDASGWHEPCQHRPWPRLPRSTVELCFAPHTTPFYPAGRCWVAATHLPHSSKHTRKVRKLRVRQAHYHFPLKGER